MATKAMEDDKTRKLADMRFSELTLNEDERLLGIKSTGRGLDTG